MARDFYPKPDATARGKMTIVRPGHEDVELEVPDGGFVVWYHPDIYPGQPTQLFIKHEEGQCQLTGAVRIVMDDGRMGDVAEFEL